MREQAYSAEVGNGFRDLFRRKKARQLSHPAYPPNKSVHNEKKENYSGIIELPSFVM
jgi:hypothetical protein